MPMGLGISASEGQQGLDLNKLQARETAMWRRGRCRMLMNKLGRERMVFLREGTAGAIVL